MTRRKPVRRSKAADSSLKPPTVEISPPVEMPPPVDTLATTGAAAPAGLKLEASCTLRDSIDMQFQLLAVDFGDSDVLVDGSAVERIDTAGLQMLVSFVKHQASRGKPVRWAAVSAELSRGSQLLGLNDLLGLAQTDNGSESRGN
jgi:anti-anti-sigma regulatory factor